MKKSIKILLILLVPTIISISNLFAKNDWLAVKYKNDGANRFLAIHLNDLDSLTYIAFSDSTDSLPPATPTSVRIDFAGSEGLEVPIDSIREIKIRSNIPTLYLTTDSLLDEVKEKDLYLSASLAYYPTDGLTDSLAVAVNIKGRGNTTWEMPKKPYRLKFDKKQSLAGMERAKNYVLIANYLDNTLMKNAVAFEMARLLEMPYVNTPVPVNLVFNGQERGCYMLTQKIGINAGSADFDEYYGMLWEIDSYYDEEYRFRSIRYDLPCMVKDPDFLEIAEQDSVTAQALWNYWKADLDLALAKAYNGKWKEVFDADQLVKYVLVNHLMGNFEISQAKSIYLYKRAPGEKYCFGPVWDFDWALGFAEHSYPVHCQLAIYGTAAYQFWVNIFSDKEFLELFNQELEKFLAEDYDNLMNFIDAYAEQIRISADLDSRLWPEERFYGFEQREINKVRFEENVELLKEYIYTRLAHILDHPQKLLF